MDIRYINDKYQFILRTSVLIFNEDETKLLLFNVEGRSFYMLTGGKIHELEESMVAIKREVKEELGWDDLEYSFLGICEELVTDKGFDNHEINLIYKGIYKHQIEREEFKGLDGDWSNYKWIDIKDIDNYKIYPKIVYNMVKDSNKIYHSVDNLMK